MNKHNVENSIDNDNGDHVDCNYDNSNNSVCGNNSMNSRIAVLMTIVIVVIAIMILIILL